VLAAAWLAAQATAPPDGLVRAGTAFERRFETAEPHTYRVELRERDFLYLVVEQRGSFSNPRASTARSVSNRSP